MIKDVVIVAGGAPALWPELARYRRKSTAWIGVDRGAYYLLERGILPTTAIGDFDSLTAVELEAVEAVVADVHYAVPEKDDTDTQLAVLLALEAYPEARIVLIGATGGRLDHFLSNLWLPLEPRFQQELHRIKLLDRQNSVSYFLPGDYTIHKEEDKKYLAYVCLTAVTDLSLYDAKYLLDKYQTQLPMSFASNEFIGETSRFSFSSGILAVIQSKD